MPATHGDSLGIKRRRREAGAAESYSLDGVEQCLWEVGLHRGLPCGRQKIARAQVEGSFSMKIRDDSCDHFRNALFRKQQRIHDRSTFFAENCQQSARAIPGFLRSLRWRWSSRRKMLVQRMRSRIAAAH